MRRPSGAFTNEFHKDEVGEGLDIEILHSGSK